MSAAPVVACQGAVGRAIGPLYRADCREPQYAPPPPEPPLATLVVSTVSQAVASSLCPKNNTANCVTITVPSPVIPEDGGPEEHPPWFLALKIPLGTLQLLAHAMEAALKKKVVVVVFRSAADAHPEVLEHAVFQSHSLAKGFAAAYAPPRLTEYAAKPSLAVTASPTK